MKRTAVLLCAALALGPFPAFGQVVIGGGAGAVYGRYGLYGYGAHGPYVIIDPWAGVPLVPRSPDTFPSCYRYGRCSAADIAAYRYRVERIERLAPSAPSNLSGQGHFQPLVPPPPPTAEQDIRPEFRGSSVVKEQYRDTGGPIDGRQ